MLDQRTGPRTCCAVRQNRSAANLPVTACKTSCRATLGALAAYLPVPSPAGSLAVAAVFGAVNLPTVAIWAAAGQALRRALTRPETLRAFNWTMAALLVASLWPVLQMQL